MRCLVVDDEPLARKGIIHHMEQLPRLLLVGECASPTEALTCLQQGGVDLLFLDIRMPRMTGLDLLRTLRDPPITIITTAYPNHALEGFELDVLDYLVKPIPFERFVKAVNKATDLLAMRQGKAGAEASSDHFFIKSEQRYERIRYDELRYVEAMQNYVVLHTTGGRHVAYLTFKAVEEYLPADRFLRVHKSYIVSRAHIDSIDGNEVRIGDKSLPVSRSQREAVMEEVLRNRLLRR